MSLGDNQHINVETRNMFSIAANSSNSLNLHHISRNIVNVDYNRRESGIPLKVASDDDVEMTDVTEDDVEMTDVTEDDVEMTEDDDEQGNNVMESNNDISGTSNKYFSIHATLDSQVNCSGTFIGDFSCHSDVNIQGAGASSHSLHCTVGTEFVPQGTLTL